MGPQRGPYLAIKVSGQSTGGRQGSVYSSRSIGKDASNRLPRRSLNIRFSSFYAATPRTGVGIVARFGASMQLTHHPVSCHRASGAKPGLNNSSRPRPKPSSSTSRCMKTPSACHRTSAGPPRIYFSWYAFEFRRNRHLSRPLRLVESFVLCSSGGRHQHQNR